MAPNRLNDEQISGFQPKAMPYKISDGAGLHLLIMPNGSKYWRMKCRISGKEKNLAFGVYPDVSLDEARLKRENARSLLAAGVDPGEYAKAEKAALLAEESRRIAASRFTLCNDGALTICLAKRSISLTPSETNELRRFLDATRQVNPEV